MNSSFSSPRRLILASQSPRRRDLLIQAGYQFEVMAPDPAVERDCPPQATVEATVLLLARSKALAVAARVERAIVLAADTLVECGGALIGKPTDRAEARRILRQLADREHRVLTGVVLIDVPTQQQVSHVESTTLRMAPLADDQIETYLDSGAWQGKAGAFGYQDGWDWLTIVRGSPTNVVGLPVELLPDLFSRLPVPPIATRPATAGARSPRETDRKSTGP